LSLNGVTGARSSGNQLWVDTDSLSTTTNLMVHLRSRGVLVKQNGQRGIVAKPALIFGKHHYDELFTALKSFN
jgi:acetylornithine/succinyldiaminopimelate/putrescine aminotransferase